LGRGGDESRSPPKKAKRAGKGIVDDDDDGRGLHSSTSRLKVSAFCWIGGALKYCLGVILRVFRRCRGVLGGVKGVFRVRNGSG